MSRIRIVADSTCDLSKELIERYGITILPLHVLLDEEEYKDGVNITPDELYVWSDKTNKTPKTSAPSLEDTQELFAECFKEAEEIIAFSISASMSASGQVLRLAAEEMGMEEHVHVVDSANLSTGIGLLILGAAELIQAGKDVPEILSWIEETKPKVRASFVLETLVYLYRGGRCSGMAALMGGVLQLHPRIAVVDGAMRPEKKYRGKMDRVRMEYAKDMEEEMRTAWPAHIFVTHSGLSEESVKALTDYVESLGRFAEIHVTRAGSVISSHCGPGCVGVLYIAE